MKKIVKALAIVMSALMLMSVLPAAALGEERMLMPGDAGDEVRALQERLRELGYDEAETDGVYGPGTEQAVRRFQQMNSLLETGIADRTTLRVLHSDGAVKNRGAESYALYEDLWDGDIAYEAPTEEAALSFYMVPQATGMPLKAANASAYGPGLNRNAYNYIRENGFQTVASAPLSTFAADVDTSSYAQLRSMILKGRKVPRDAVRIEEMLNYFRYAAGTPENDDPFHVAMELSECPWNAQTRLLRVCLTARTVPQAETAPRHLVFLIDTSGSMEGRDRLDLVKRAFLMLLDTMDARDHISIVTYASSERTVLEYVSAGEKTRIMEAISDLSAGGWTNGSAGLIRAYELADRYRADGQDSRILLATDGDLNVGVTSEGDLARLVMEKKAAGTALTVLGFGYGNYQDNRMEALADYGDGNCYYIDTIYEARKALIEQGGGTFSMVAKDVKLQLDFNPAYIKGYRLIGYEDRVMSAEAFDDDTKDGGEVGSGQQVTALYELVLPDSGFELGGKESRYGSAPKGEENGQWLTLDIRAKAPGSDASTLYSYPLAVDGDAVMSRDQAFAAAVAMTGMILRDSEYRGTSDYGAVLGLLREKTDVTGDPYREEFLYMATLLERQN